MKCRYMKSKQLRLIEIFLTIQYVNLVYKFSKMYLSYSLNFLLINNSYFSRMALVGFQYEPIILDVNKVCFNEEQHVPHAR